MALFKILKGNENNLPTTKTPGYMYITEDQGNIFVDLSTTERIQLNAKNASTSNKWATPMKLSLTGDASGSTTFDGSNEASITVQLKMIVTIMLLVILIIYKQLLTAKQAKMLLHKVLMV